MGYTYPRNWRWLWLRRRAVPLWQTFAIEEGEITMAINKPTTFNLRTRTPDDFVLDSLTPTP